MGDHYVPKHYLLGFAVGKSVWVYDKQTRSHYRTQAKSTANETGMYSPELESFLANDIEQPAQTVLEKIRQQKDVSSEDKVALSRYIGFMWQRVPKGRLRALTHVLPQAADELKEEMLAELDRAAAAHPDLAHLAPERRALILEIIAKQKETASPELWQKAMLENRSPRVAAAIAGMSWKFVVSERDQFLTSDNPLFFFEHEGIGRPQSELSFPISAAVCLVASNTNRHADGAYFRAFRP